MKMDGEITDIELAGPVVLAEINYDQMVVFAGSLTDIAHREISIGDRIRCYEMAELGIDRVSVDSRRLVAYPELVI